MWPKGVTYNPCPDGLKEGGFILKYIFPDLSTMLNKMDISKFGVDVFEEMEGLGGW